MRLRISIGLAALLAALGVLAIGVGSAGATENHYAPDPQTTNVPYLAWAGEEVKVVKCIGGNDGIDVSAVSQQSGIERPAVGQVPRRGLVRRR